MPKTIKRDWKNWQTVLRLCPPSHRWRELLFADGEPVGNRPGCYAVYVRSKLVYIGQACDLQKRLISHGFDVSHYSTAVVTPWGRFADVRFKVCYSRKFGDWLMREARLINRLRPKFNRRFVTMGVPNS